MPRIISEGMPPNIQDKLEDEARAALKKSKALFDAKNLPVETVLEAGLVPANLIITKAQDGKFDRIIIGSTGMNALERILMGSPPPRWWRMPPAKSRWSGNQEF